MKNENELTGLIRLVEQKDLVLEKETCGFAMTGVELRNKGVVGSISKSAAKVQKYPHVCNTSGQIINAESSILQKLMNYQLKFTNCL